MAEKIVSNKSNLQILHEDNHIIVINKRVGDIVQGDKTGDKPLSEIVKADSISAFEKASEPKILAVLLEGKFKSAYANRSEQSDYPNFKKENTNGKMIVIADGDVGRNQILKGKALPLGVDLLTQQQYGNGQFLENALAYLLDDTNIMELKNREIAVRLLDRQRIEEEKTYWQWLNMLLPIVIIALFAGLFYWLRKRKFA